MKAYARLTIQVTGTTLIALALVLGRITLEPRLFEPDVQTATSEHRLMMLEDGSSVQLAKNSRLTIDFVPSERSIELSRGRAHFEVEKDPHRPFIVKTPHARIRAIGTVFNVAILPDGSFTNVKVIEGRVEIQGHANLSSPSSLWTASRNRFVLGAGSEAAVAPDGSLVLSASAQQPPAAGDAQQVEFAFTEVPLADVIAELNWHNTRAIRIADPNLAGLAITGRFSRASLLSYLERYRNVAIENGPKGEVVLQLKRSDGGAEQR